MKEVIVSSAFNKRLISRLMSSRPVDSSNTNFVLKGSKDFTARSKDIFGELKPLENAHQTWITENKIQDSFQNSHMDVSEFSNSNLKSVCKTDIENPVSSNVSSDLLNNSNDSTTNFPVFKKPECIKNHRRRCGIVPNCAKRRKWKKYSLEDTPLSSNADNASIALNFIDSLRKRKLNEQDLDENKDGKIMFSKPQSKVSSSSLNKQVLKIAERQKAEFCPIKLDHLESEYD